MKYCVFLIVTIQVFALQSNAQCIPGIGPVVAGPAVVPAPAVIQAGSVANTLADTLSLLTVSSLLAEKLPLGMPMVSSCGCGCGYPLGTYVY